MMPFGVDVLGTLTMKLKQMIDEAQAHYSLFLNASQIYKQGKINEKEYFDKVAKYLITISALNFLAIRVILELKTTMEKGTSIKDATGGMASMSPSHQTSFGIGGFVNMGGSVGASGYTISTPQQLQEQGPIYKPVDIEVQRSPMKNKEKITNSIGTKNCIICGHIIPMTAKFCSKCGNSQ